VGDRVRGQRLTREDRLEVRRRVAAGRSVAQVAADLDVSAQAIYNWRRQERIDRGELAGMTSSEHGELGAATPTPARSASRSAQ
jgi:transposase-like protein